MQPGSPIAQLQRMAGNQAMQQLMRTAADDMAADADVARILRAADRAQKEPDDRTGMFLRGSEIAYRIISKFLAHYSDRISGAGCNDTVDGVKAERSGRNNISVTIGRAYVLSLNAQTLQAHVAQMEEALKKTGVAPAEVTPSDTPAAPVVAEPPATPSAAEQAAAREKEFAEKGAAALAAVVAAGHKQGTHLRGKLGQGKVTAGKGIPLWFMELHNALMLSGEWKQVEENAQHVLRDYATWFVEHRHGGVMPESLRTFFDYIGRSSQSDADARANGFLGTAHFGGTLGAPNWCTYTSNRSLLDGLRAAGFEPSIGEKDFLANLLLVKGQEKGFYSRNEAYARDLQPGDIVMFLFDKCQWGGHTATVVEDLGDSFVHVSGNTGDAIGVGISEAKRMKQKPGRLDLDVANDSSSPAAKTAANAHIASIPFGDQVLVYSITRSSQPFAALMELNTVDAATQPDRMAAVLNKYHLRKVKPK